jgi:DNA-binding transcriptional ArsR family regulator
MEHEQIVRLLSATSEPARLELIFLLSREGRLNVNEIARHFTLSRPAISHHLRILKEVRILRSEKQGQEMYYWLDREHLVSAFRSLADEIEQCEDIP